MNLIINTTTLSGTGVTQVAVSFIYECIAFPENTYHVFLGQAVSKEINVKDFPDNFHFYEFEGHPIYGLKGWSIRKRLRQLENEISPDVMFTVFGPACWTPKTKNISGFAKSDLVYPESPLFKKIPFKNVLQIKFTKIMHRFFLKRNGKYFVCETEDMSERLSGFLKVDRSKVFTVSNTYNKYFETESALGNKKLLPEPGENEYRFLTLASFQIHKNLTVLNEVIPILNKKDFPKDFKFILTVDPAIYEQNFTEEARKRIINLGRIEVKDCPQLYSESDALFLPTLIEAFSANYPEAMKMEIPVVTSNYSFATTICENAALYFDPLDPEDIASKLIQIASDEKLSEQLVENGKERLKVFGNARTRAQRYLEVFKSL